jgi:hypothetical protein
MNEVIAETGGRQSRRLLGTNMPVRNSQEKGRRCTVAAAASR